tara:strand:- start:129 stop:278 length:150 start_codon:yes stop_codon:yes gene_type:complete
MNNLVKKRVKLTQHPIGAGVDQDHEVKAKKMRLNLGQVNKKASNNSEYN